MKKYLILILFTLQWGCTRSIDEAQIQIELPQSPSQKLSSLSGEILAHIVVNISGPGIQKTIVWDWDAQGSNDQPLSPPEFISISVPAGADRLIQYLGVYQDSDEKMFFSYGDNKGRLANLVPGTNAVEIITEDIGVQGKQGMISGQYVTNVLSDNRLGTGPTGKVAIEFKPSTGAPPMIISFGEIMSGWFNFFAIEGAPLTYRLMVTGQLLSGLNFDELKNSIELPNVPANYAMISSPSVYWVAETGSSRRRKSHGGNIIYGFFGPRQQNMNFSSQSGGRASHYNTAVSLGDLFADESGGTPLNWSASGGGTDFYLVGGGDSESNLSGYENFKNKLYIDPTTNFKNGIWSYSGFVGAFRNRTTASFQTVSGCSGSGGEAQGHACYDSASNNMEVDWEYINEVLFTGPDALTGVTLFVTKIPNCDGEFCNDPWQSFKGEEGGGDGYRCKDLQRMGFTKIGDYESTDASSATFNFQMNTTSERFVGFLCPYKNTPAGRLYFSQAGRVESMWSHSGVANINNIQLQIGSDSVHDAFLVDQNPNADPLVSWDFVEGATDYSIVVRNESDTINVCGPMNSNSHTDFTFSSCGSALNDEGSQYKLQVKAFDSNNELLATGETYFYRVVNVPTVPTVTVTCIEDGSFVKLNLTIESTIASNVFVVINYDGGGANSSNYSVVASTSNHTLSTGMSNVGNYNNVTLNLKSKHISGYEVPGTEVNFSVTSGATCSF